MSIQLWLKIFGYTPSELTGKSPLIYVHPGDKTMVSESIQHRIKGKTKTAHYEFHAICKNGEEKIIEVLGANIEIGGKPATFSNLLDITERKHAEEELSKMKSYSVVFLSKRQLESHKQKLMGLIYR